MRLLVTEAPSISLDGFKGFCIHQVIIFVKNSNMETALLRAEIHEYVDHADERFLNLVYGMIKADHIDYEMSEEEIRVIEDRLNEYKKNPESGKSWKEVKGKLSNNS